MTNLGIATAVRPDEAEYLLVQAAGKNVLELGADQGYSAVLMGQVAASMHSVDHFKGDLTMGYDDHLPRFRANVRRHAMEDRIVLHIGRFDQVVPLFAPASFDFVFVDGCHIYEEALIDGMLARGVLRPGGLIAFHDIGAFNPDGVANAVDELAQVWGCEVLLPVGSLAVLKPS